MKLLVVFVSLVVACVLGATDPTKVCLPEVFEGDVSSATNRDFGKLAVDFKLGLFAITYLKAGLRVVVNLKNFEGSAINIKDGSCKKILVGAHINNIASRCYPASGKSLTNGPGVIGVPVSGVSTGAWEIDVNGGVTKIALPAGKDPEPVIRQFTSGGKVDVSLASNSFSISDYGIFNVPNNCTSAAIVG